MSSARFLPREASLPATRPVRHLLVLPDREAAEEAAAETPARFGLGDEPEVVREALAGEDDAEDAQWLVVIEDPERRLDPAELDAFAARYEGWVETEEAG
ncbi:hypothetical protein [Streptomyces sp. Ru87]|uniref:hypothetical protein n=1 Tax=Streptomyces sp. Ru87 TaxID=2044307 RepID=UPI000BF3A361|nr:hypothetical protein [Streptomyces sp. Ru87]PGH50438.1 hypothetical protein CRI70_12095 [Streptomyces sp. Ru87]